MTMELTTVQVQFAGGLRTKDDPRAMKPPGLSICADARFDDLGGIQTRYPFAAQGVNILGGGTLSNFRRLVDNGAEQLCFTKDTLYSWSARDAAWVNKGTHLAVAVTEADRFGGGADQHDADRAELSNTVVYAWTESGTAKVFVGAIDKTTGAVIMAPTVVQDNSGFMVQPRLIALSTRILLFWISGISGNSLQAIAIDPANVATSVGAASSTIMTTISGITLGQYYDVDRAPGTDTAIACGTGLGGSGYIVASVTSSLAIVSAGKARTSGAAAVGIACHPDGLHFTIARINASSLIVSDYLAISSLADVTSNQAVAAVATAGNSRIAMAYRSVQNGGRYRCYLFWNDTDSAPNVYSNWVDDGNTLGTATKLLSAAVNLASRAFDYNGSVYFWTVFTENSSFSGGNTVGFRAQLQNTYFLFRDDGAYFAKATSGVAGSISSTGSLPGVALTGGTTTYTWAALRKTRISLSANQTGYATARVPREISFTFDTNDARRCARLGNTLYIAAGEILQYDGVRLTEVGFPLYPWTFAASDSGAAGSLAAAQYAYKMTLKWQNAVGEIDRSTTATIASVTMAANRKAQIASFGPMLVTHKTASPPAAEVWRTAGNPTADSPFYLATSSDPNNATNPNRYLASNATALFQDNLADASLTVLQSNPQNGGILENLSPPPATMIVATDTRLFLAGVPGDPDRVWYSKLRAQGEVAAFNDALVVNVPSPGGALAGLALLNETLVAFRQRAIYTLPGDGYSNDGSGSNYGPARLVANDVGAVNPDAIGTTPEGLVFKTSKGWYLLDRGWNCKYVGSDVAAFDGDTIYAVHTISAFHHVRIVTNARVLIFDYLTQEWSAWSIADGLHACVWSGSYVYLSSVNGPMKEQTSFAGGTTYGLDVETGWIEPDAYLENGLSVREFQILGEFRGACALRIRTAFDYQYDGSGSPVYTDDITWPVSPTTIGSALQVQRGTSRPKCEAIKIRITAVLSVIANTSPPITEAVKLTAIDLRIGRRKGAFKRLPAAQKV